MHLNVTSEFGRLREAIVHRPGRELVRMTASTREYFLFDDLLYDEHARQEHDWFSDLLQKHLGIKVHFFDKLLAEALAAASAQDLSMLITQVCRLEEGMPPVEQRIGHLEVMVRWSQGHGWPQYSQDPEGDPAGAAPGTLPGTLTGPLALSMAGVNEATAYDKQQIASHQAQQSQEAQQDSQADDFSYVRARLSAWCEEKNYVALAEELIEGIETRAEGVSPTERVGPKSLNEGGSLAHGEDMGALVRFAEGQLFYLTPLPNMMFINDTGTIVSDRLLLSRMAAPGRAREPLLFDFVQRNHPVMKEMPRWVWADARINDPAWPYAASPFIHLEGGNVIQLRDDLVVVGVNVRTSVQAVQRVADAWRERAIAEGRTIVLYILRLPVGFNHLDSVLGVISDTECIVYPPVFEPYGPASVDVVRIELNKEPVRPTRSADFFQSLRNDGLDLTPILCGGPDPADQQREQWFSSANLLALAPGKVVIYRSSEATIAELARHGYNIVDINDVQTGAIKLDLDSPGKWALKIKGSELSRGHGGPHSLVMALVRDS